MFKSIFKKAIVAFIPVLGSASILIAGCAGESTDTESLGESEGALTAAQCSVFDINGKVQICHKTGSTNKPYTILRVAEAACISGHVAHGGDYVTSTDPHSPLYDPTCNGGGCLPVSAPCDATLPCCDGSSCVNGTCHGTPPDPCSGVTCVAIDQCHTVGTCDSTTGACSSPAKVNGTACNDGNGCTTTDACSAGTCTGSTDPCQNGSACSSNGASYTCACAPGYEGSNCEIDSDDCWNSPCLNNGQCVDLVNGYQCNCPAGFTGTNCEVDIDDCQEANLCNNGQCTDLVNAYQCTCYAGWTGTNCDQPEVVTCPCTGSPAWDNGITQTFNDCQDFDNYITLWYGAYGFVEAVGDGSGFTPYCSADDGQGSFVQQDGITNAQAAACLALLAPQCPLAPPPPPVTCPCSGDAAWIAALDVAGPGTCYGGIVVVEDVVWSDASQANFCASGTDFAYGDPDYFGASAIFRNTTAAENAACAAEVQAACNAPPPTK